VVVAAPAAKELRPPVGEEVVRRTDPRRDLVGEAEPNRIRAQVRAERRDRLALHSHAGIHRQVAARPLVLREEMDDARGGIAGGAEVVDLVVAEGAAPGAYAGHAARERRIPEDVHLAARIASIHSVAVASHAAADLQG